MCEERVKMRVGAVVTAANNTERDRNIRAFDDIEVMSAPERIVATLKKCGIDLIVVVTGYDAALKKRMRHFGLCFVENKGYDVTDVMASAKLGLKQIYEKCDRIIYCPSGFPFFREETVKALLQAEGDVIIPSFDGKKGHPVVIDAGIIPDILSYDGDRGMTEAMKLSSENIILLPVDDDGCISSKEDDEEIRMLIDEQNKNLIRPRVDLSLVGTRKIIGTEMKQLLIQIDSLGSVREACEKVGISYSKGWNLIRDCEDELKFRLVERHNGGKFGGEASLTEEGKDILRRYREYEEAVAEFAGLKFDEYFKGILSR